MLHYQEKTSLRWLPHFGKIRKGLFELESGYYNWIIDSNNIG